jgi:putrescine transport system permease protein
MNIAHAFARWRPSGRTLVIAVPFGFLLLFFMLPFAVVVKISFAEMRLAVPPYGDVFTWDHGRLMLTGTLEHYRAIFTDDLYVVAYLSSIRVAFVTTLICLLIGYPAAYLIARAPDSRRHLLLMAVILPFWTSYLIRVYAWIGLLKDQGLVNQVLIAAGLIDQPLRMHPTPFGLYVGMVYSYLPYMILPLYAFLVRMDRTLEEAATDLGAPPWQVFATITLPLSARGIAAGSLLVFIPSVGEYVIPELLGGPDALMIGRVLWDDFFNNIAWPLAAAATCVMVALLLLPMVWFQRVHGRESLR